MLDDDIEFCRRDELSVMLRPEKCVFINTR